MSAEGRLLKRQFVVVLAEHIRGLNHGKHILLRKYVDALATKTRYAKGLCSRVVFTELPKNREHTMDLHHHLANSMVVYVRCSGAASQETGKYPIFQDVQYSPIVKDNAIILFIRSYIAQRTLALYL